MSNKNTTISEFSFAMTNIRSLCPDGKKASLKLKAITDMNADIHVIVDSRLDKLGLKKWRKTNKQIISKYNIYGNYSKIRGVTILAKRSIGVTITNVNNIDEKTQSPSGCSKCNCRTYPGWIENSAPF